MFKFSAEETSIKNKSSLKELSKGFKLKSTYTTKGKNNITDAYDDAYHDLVFGNKKIYDVLYKKVNNELSDSSKNIFQEAKKLFNLRVEIFKKLVLEKENLKFEKSIGKTVKLKIQKHNFSKTPEQKNFNNFLEQIKGEQKDIDINWFQNVFNYKTPDEMLKYLHSLKTADNYNRATSLMEENFTDFKDEVKIMSEGDKKKQESENNEYYGEYS